MKHFLFTISALLFFSLSVQSQDLVNTQTLVSSGLIYSFDASDKSIKGSPYLNDTFAPAQVSASKELLMIKYNLVSDEMEVKSDKDGIYALNKNFTNLTVTFTNNNATYQIFNFINDDNLLDNGFFMVLSNPSSNIKLLLKQTKKFVEREESKSSYQEGKPAHFKTLKDKYYIVVGEQNAVELPKNKKHIAQLFPDFGDDILSFIKKNKIRTSNKEDLIKLVDYINGLQ